MSKTYVVTAGNRGLGLEFARQLSIRGERVIATARAPQTAGKLKALGVDVRELDVGDGDSVDRFAAGLEGESIDVLINNAGVGVNSCPFEDLDFAEMEDYFRVNAVGPLRVTRGLLPMMRRGADRKVVNLTSRMGSIGDNSGGAAYSYRASKAGLNMATKSLAVDLADDGFVCVVMHPGWVETDMGGSRAPVQPQESITGMIGVIDGLETDDNGGFFDFTGAVVPW